MNVDATHWNAPVYFLYFHAIELYLKAFLYANGVPLKELESRYGHKAEKLAKKAEEFQLELNPKGKEVIRLMAETDSVISSRYIRIGTHTRFPLMVYDDLCRYLHQHTVKTVAEASDVTQLPGIWERPPESPASVKPGQYPSE